MPRPAPAPIAVTDAEWAAASPAGHDRARRTFGRLLPLVLWGEPLAQVWRAKLVGIAVAECELNMARLAGATDPAAVEALGRQEVATHVVCLAWLTIIGTPLAEGRR